MMHASTSPQYAIIASNDVTAAMMDGAGGTALTTESIREAVAFRQTMGRIRKQLQDQGDWFFGDLEPRQRLRPATGKHVRFELADENLLATNPACWLLRPGEAWHGFGDIEDGFCMLDPIKVSLLTPGIAANGDLEPSGHPATLVTAYLDAKGIVVEKTPGLLDPCPLLDRRYEGQVRLAVDRAARLQKGLRRQYAACRRHARAGRRHRRGLRTHGAARPGRRDVRSVPHVGPAGVACRCLLDPAEPR